MNDKVRSKPEIIRDLLSKCSANLSVSKMALEGLEIRTSMNPEIKLILMTLLANRRAIVDLRMAVSLLTDYREDEEHEHKVK